MKITSLLLVSLALVLLGLTPVVADQAGHGPFVCPHLHGTVDTTSSEPGRCPVCGMELVPRDEVSYVAILVFDGVQIIDYTAPYEVFGQARFTPYLVSPDGEPIITTMGMRVVPHYSFAEAPAPDILLVPGGNVGEMRESQQVLEWVRHTAAGSDHVLSVCNGAFILAQAGLLDGLEATTFHRLLEDLAIHFPRVDVVRGVRFVDNGKIVTSAGLSAGIDAAIHLVGKIQGQEAAEKLAAHIEYAWDPEAGSEPQAVGQKLGAAEIHAYDGLYEFEGGGEVIVRGSAEDRILYAQIGDERYPVLPLGDDRFLNVAGDEVEFVRSDDGLVIGYREVEDGTATEVFARLGDLPAPRR